MDLRVLLADDHTILRGGIRRILDDEPGIKVIGEAEDGREAAQTALDMAPDIVIMDINMPGLNGLEASRQILKNNPRIKILILSMYSEQSFVEKALSIGVSGYVLKNSAIVEMVTAIKTVGKGKVYLSPDIAEIIVEEYKTFTQLKEEIEKPTLTPREREVLQLLAEGASTKQIANSLNLSERTVEVHRKNIMGKLNLHTLPELTKYAVREGLTSLDL